MKMIKKYPRIFIIIGITTLIVGLTMSTDTNFNYITSLILSGVGGLVTGFSSRFITKK